MDPDTTNALVTQEIVSIHRTRINAYPYIYYTPETEVALGVGGIITFYTAKERILRPSKAVLNGYYSTKKQYKISLAPQVYFLKNRYFFSANLDYGYYVDKFWGVGRDTPEIDNEQFISSGWGAEVQFHVPPILQKIGFDKLGFIYDYYNSTIRDKQSNPYLMDPTTRGNCFREYRRKSILRSLSSTVISIKCLSKRRFFIKWYVFIACALEPYPIPFQCIRSAQKLSS